MQPRSTRIRVVGFLTYFRLKLIMRDLEESASPGTLRLGLPMLSMSGNVAMAIVLRSP
jgi:hypothetical protein